MYVLSQEQNESERKFREEPGIRRKDYIEAFPVGERETRNRNRLAVERSPNGPCMSECPHLYGAGSVLYVNVTYRKRIFWNVRTLCIAVAALTTIDT
jgi:hypothetical protein